MSTTAKTPVKPSKVSPGKGGSSGDKKPVIVGAVSVVLIIAAAVWISSFLVGGPRYSNELSQEPAAVRGRELTTQLASDERYYRLEVFPKTDGPGFVVGGVVLSAEDEADLEQFMKTLAPNETFEFQIEVVE